MLGLNINTDEYDLLVTFQYARKGDKYFEIRPKSPGDGWFLVEWKATNYSVSSFLWAKKKTYNNGESK